METHDRILRNDFALSSDIHTALAESVKTSQTLRTMTRLSSSKISKQTPSGGTITDQTVSNWCLGT